MFKLVPSFKHVQSLTYVGVKVTVSQFKISPFAGIDRDEIMLKLAVDVIISKVVTNASFVVISVINTILSLEIHKITNIIF